MERMNAGFLLLFLVMKQPVLWKTGELKVGTYTYTHNDLEKALLTLNSGALSDLSWIEERPLAEGSSAFSDLDNGQTAAPNIVLHPHV